MTVGLNNIECLPESLSRLNCQYCVSVCVLSWPGSIVKWEILLVERDEGARLGWARPARPPELCRAARSASSALLWPTLLPGTVSQAGYMAVLLNIQHISSHYQLNISQKYPLNCSKTSKTELFSPHFWPAIGWRQGRPANQERLRLLLLHHRTAASKVPTLFTSSSAQLYEGRLGCGCTTRCISVPPVSRTNYIYSFFSLYSRQRSENQMDLLEIAIVGRLLL